MMGSNLAWEVPLDTNKLYTKISGGLKKNVVNQKLPPDYEMKGILENRNLSYREIGERLGVHKVTIEQCAKRLGIRRRGIYVRTPPITPEVALEIAYLYVHEKQTCRMIATPTHLKESKIYSELRRRGLARHNKQAQALRIKKIPAYNMGYPMKRMPNHPRAFKRSQSVPIHFLVAEEKLGRPLMKSERVHHIDLTRANYSADNLYVFASNSEHFKCHFQLMSVAAELYKLGLIGFKSGSYFVNREKLSNCL